MRYNGATLMKPEVGLRWRTLRCLLWGWGRNELGLRSAALTYYAVFSLFPLMLLALTLAGWMTRSPEAQKRWVDLVMGVFPREAESVVRAATRLSWDVSTAGVVAGLSLLWSASGYVRLLLATIDRVHARTATIRRRTWWFPHALGTAAVMLLVPVALLTVSVGSTMVHLLATIRLPNGAPLVSPWVVNSMVMLGVAVTALYLAFHYLPARRGPRRAAASAAVFTALGWLVAGQGLRWYLRRAWGHYNIFYGPLASVVVLMFYLYVLNVILLMGAQLHAIWSRGQGCTPPPLPRWLAWLDSTDGAAPQG